MKLAGPGFGETLPELMGLREYGRHRGVSLAAVQKAISTGRIPVEIVGKHKKIDPKKADAAWDAHTAPKQAPVTTRAGQRAFPGMEDVAQRSQVDEHANGSVGNYNAYRTLRERYTAGLTMLEYEQKSGTLISAEEVNRQYFELARELRDSILNIPERVAALLAATTKEDEAYKILTDELNSALTSVADKLAKRAGSASDVGGVAA